MNNYHIYDEIGRGKFSVVYKGRKKKSFEYLAVKSVEKNRRKKILNEVKIMHSLDNEHILKFYNWYETRNHLWIIFEYCAGGSLNTIIESDKKLPEKVIIEFAQDLITSLFYLHSSGIIYGDLKPHTILFTEYGILKLGDFGLSKKVSELIQTEDNNEKKGTPFYMAPELFQEEGVPSFYSDFWSLGCVLYELATGQPPFVSSSLQELVQKILNEDLKIIPGFSEEFNSLVADLLQKDCSKRISWEELLEHRVWGSDAKRWNGTMPSQPLYEKYLISKGLTQRTQVSITLKSHIPKVDLVRISQNIHKNLLRESREYSQNEYEVADVKLADKDQILDFGEHKHEIEENEKPDEEGYEEEKVEKAGKVDKIDKFDKVDKIDKIGKIDKIDKIDKIGKIDKADKVDKITKNDKKVEINNFRPMTIQAKVREITIDDKSNQRSNSAQSTPSSKSLQNAPPLLELVLHSSDTTVKPIVGNKEIDKPLELSFSVQTFPFATLSQEEVLRKGESTSLDDHFQEIFTALNTPSVDKQNLLTYFESIILNAAVANKLINSVFVNYFIKLLKTGKNMMVKARVCSILGQLLRHSTLINNELSQSGLYQALSENTRDKNEKLSRKATAALGEYLFYAATQMDESQNEWEIPTTIFALVMRTCKSAEDEAVRFYACKTIENISAQSQRAGCRFSTNDVMTTMISTYSTSKHESFRCSVSVVLSHIIRLNTSLIQSFLDKFPMKQISSSIGDEQPRIQQSFLTILLYIFMNDQRASTLISDDRNLLSNLIKALESSAIVVRGKSLLVLYHVVRSNSRSLARLAELKLFQILEKLLRDSYKYVQQCMCHLLEILGDVAAQGIRNLHDDLKRGVKVLSYQHISSIINSPACSLKLPFANCFKYLGDCLSLTLTSEGLAAVLNILEALTAHSKGMTSAPDLVVDNLLPVLLRLKNSSDNDLKFRCFKLFSDILITYLYEEAIYDPNLANKPVTRKINDLIGRALLPEYRELLGETDPIPLYALKLLSAILERNISFVAQVKKLALFNMIIENFEGGNPRLNLHLISVVKKIIESHELSIDELGQMGVIDRVSSVMRVIQEQDWCVEKMLDILYELLSITTDALRVKRNDQSLIKITEPLCENFISCTKILGFINEPVLAT